jgi:hypothetical protein
MLSDNAMCILKAIRLGAGIRSIPSGIYNELASAGLTCASVPCLPDFALTDAGIALVADVQPATDPACVPPGYFRDVSRPCPVVDDGAGESVGST